MNTLCELTAAEIVCTIAGREYRLSPLTAGDFGELERQLLHQRPVTLDQLIAWLMTPVGQAHALRLSLRRNHRDVTLEQTEELLQLAVAEGSDLCRRWPELLGGPPGNSSGQT